jgi:hypothetical protein
MVQYHINTEQKIIAKLVLRIAYKLSDTKTARSRVLLSCTWSTESRVLHENAIELQTLLTPPSKNSVPQFQHIRGDRRIYCYNNEE